MSNKSKKPKKKQPKEEPQQPVIPPEPEGETEGGPIERERQFLGERLSRLRPKGEELGEERHFGHEGASDAVRNPESISRCFTSAARMTSTGTATWPVRPERP